MERKCVVVINLLRNSLKGRFFTKHEEKINLLKIHGLRETCVEGEHKCTILSFAFRMLVAVLPPSVV